MAIYTKRGDKGKTGLYSRDGRKRRVSKDSLKIKTLGAIDEANTYLGVVKSLSKNRKLIDFIENIQNNLFIIGASIAGSELKIGNDQVKLLEKKIDRLEGKLPVLKNFILPGGSGVSSSLMFARALVRKAERAAVSLNKKAKVDPNTLIYLNRLSDALFMLAREENHKAKIKEVKWLGKRKGY